jgi:enolase
VRTITEKEAEMRSVIESVTALEVLDSRGNPTLEVTLVFSPRNI